ncbi:MAG: DUF4185 domain-containing protein [Gammaproteobacteria bacterium]|nr:DUF4185 domain-containing protein [Gammaproteobacteria bacterium]
MSAANSALDRHRASGGGFRFAQSTLLYWLAAGAVTACGAACADPLPADTTVLGPFTGHYAPLHPDNLAPFRIHYYGTDLGWSYEHDGKIQFLFGDTNATEGDERIQASTRGVFDDAFGTIELAEWPDPAKITPHNIPLIRLGQNPGTTETSAIDPGHAMEGFKTPIGGFGNGSREFGVFYTSKPRACNADADCGGGFACDSGLGFAGEPWDTDRGLTFGCLDGSPGCIADTMKDAAGAPVRDTGFCVDRTSTIWADSEAGRIGAMALKHLVGIRDTSDPRRYTNAREWITNKFANVAVRTVSDFVAPGGARGESQDYRPAKGSGGRQRVFLWGRPGFIGVAATGRPLGLYFAYADMPSGPEFSWNLTYYAGLDAAGRPRFSRNERDAAAVDLDATREGVQHEEIHDVVDQMSLSWVEPLHKWVMFYGGGMVDLPLPTLPNCGVLEIFTRSDCTRVVLGNGAIRMRSAGQPWGPWTPPDDVLVGGDPDRVPLEYQYAPGGVLHHPACADPACVTHTRSAEVTEHEYGFLYGANIIEQWTRPAEGGADLIWNVSTWDPYRVVLVRTRIDE